MPLLPLPPWIGALYPWIIFSPVCIGCRFPRFLQSVGEGGGGQWLGDAMFDGGGYARLVVSFSGRTMLAVQSGDEEAAGRGLYFQRECLVELTDGRYLFIAPHRHHLVLTCTV